LRLCVEIGLGLALAPLVFEADARAQPPAALAEAKDLFNRGLALLDAGDHERALDYFLRSRALVPGKGNTTNAAHCLDKLGRYDEALELYEELVTRFADDLTPENRARLVPAMTALRARVANLVVTANVDGAVVVDGRSRGRLPLAGALRVLGGAHAVRVLKDGYETREAKVTVGVGQTARVDLVLTPLAHAGRLRLEDPSNEGAEVFVDGVEVGTVPWEGTVATGDHVVWTASSDRGSVPTRAVVIQGQTAILALRSDKLGPPVTVAVEPRTAEVRLDGVPLGSGAWRGRLPVGSHEVEASEPGYVTLSTRFDEPDAAGKPPRVVVTLAVDPRHPRWPRRPAGGFRVDVFAGFAAGRGVGSDAEIWCGSSCARVLGGLVGGRAGFRFPFGLSLDLDGGYASFAASFTRSRATSFKSAGAARPLTYDLGDALRLRGPLVGASIGWEARLASRFSLVGRATAGALIAESTDPITGTATSEGRTVPIVVTDRGELLRSVLPFIEPELAVEANVREFRVALGLGYMAFLGAGPAFSHALVEVSPAGCSRMDPGGPACAPGSTIVAGERAYRAFSVWVPSVAAGYAF
jgi:hypothetical protein